MTTPETIIFILRFILNRHVIFDASRWPNCEQWDADEGNWEDDQEGRIDELLESVTVSEQHSPIWDSL